jgi:four helix bundle protein
MPDRPLESFQSRSFRLALAILKLYRKIRRVSDAPIHFANQMLRAGTSIGANLEEARSAYSDRDLASRHTVALKEGRETDYWLKLIRADQPQLATDIDPISDECNQMVAMLTASVKKLRSKRRRCPNCDSSLNS